MTPWNIKQRARWAQLAEHIDAMEMARLDAFEDAFDRLRMLDNELAQLALEAFIDADIAADCLARHRVGSTGATAYWLLAHGQRPCVAAWLREEIDVVRAACSRLNGEPVPDRSQQH